MRIKVVRMKKRDKGATPSNCGVHRNGSTDK